MTAMPAVAPRSTLSSTTSAPARAPNDDARRPSRTPAPQLPSPPSRMIADVPNGARDAAAGRPATLCRSGRLPTPAGRAGCARGPPRPGAAAR
eukprot:7018417-Prymnesium_polylepis.1